MFVVMYRVGLKGYYCSFYICIRNYQQVNVNKKFLRSDFCIKAYCFFPKENHYVFYLILVVIFLKIQPLIALQHQNQYFQQTFLFLYQFQPLKTPFCRLTHKKPRVSVRLRYLVLELVDFPKNNVYFTCEQKTYNLLLTLNQYTLYEYAFLLLHQLLREDY
jgi:hypothetical protein